MKQDEILQIVNDNGLQTNTSNGEVYYNNQIRKNFTDNVFIQIQTDGRLKIECSLHKYYNYLKERKSVNFDMFTIKQAKETAIQLIENKHITANELSVYRFEIGLNITVSEDCRKYLDLIQGIGAIGSEKELNVNMKFKDFREKTTIFHKDKRKYYKIYDKVFEMRDKRYKQLPDIHILRIETVYRRIEKMSFEQFFSLPNLKKVVEQFFNDWATVNFDRDIITPLGTHYAKQALCKEIIKYGAETALKHSKTKYKEGFITNKQYRTIREFIINDWPTFKTEIRQVPTPQEREFRKQLSDFEKALRLR